MTVYDHKSEDKVVVEMTEKEFILFAFLIEKAAKESKSKIALSKKMAKQIDDYVKN